MEEEGVGVTNLWKCAVKKVKGFDGGVEFDPEWIVLTRKFGNTEVNSEMGEFVVVVGFGGKLEGIGGVKEKRVEAGEGETGRTLAESGWVILDKAENGGGTPFQKGVGVPGGAHEADGF